MIYVILYCISVIILFFTITPFVIKKLSYNNRPDDADYVFASILTIFWIISVPCCIIGIITCKIFEIIIKYYSIYVEEITKYKITFNRKK